MQSNDEEFWKYLEVECVAECCGIDAFSFWVEDINRAAMNSKIKNLDIAIDTAIKEFSNLKDEVSLVLY